MTRSKGKFLQSHFLTVAIGLVLIPTVAVISFLVTYYIGYFYADSTGNTIFLSDEGLYVFISCFANTIFLSYVYFSLRKIPTRILLPIYSLISVLVLYIFISRIFLMQKERQAVLESYLELRQTVVAHDYEGAFNLMSPEYRQKNTVDDFRRDISLWRDMEAFEEVDSIYTVEVDMLYWNPSEAGIITDPKTSLWYRPGGGVVLEFEKIEGKWYLDGRIAFYIHG